MNTTEDKVRMALRETGEEISPRSVPPLRLRSDRRRARLPRIPGRWSTWLTPLAAAAAVAAVVAGSLAISATFHGHARSTGQAAAARWNGSPVGPRSALHKVPPYFVMLPPQALIYARTAEVRSTVTGRVLATVSPPRPYKVFTWVSGTADDRTFVLAAQRWWNISPGQAGTHAQDRDNNAPTVFFKLAFDPATRTAMLTRLTVPEKIRATNLGGVGVSPGGTRLALDFRNSIQIVTLATGAVRTWTWPRSGWIGNWKPEGQIFSWSADGRYLEFQQWGGRRDTMHVRILDTTAPGTSLTAARVIVAYPYRPGANTYATGDSFLTPDGTRIVTSISFFPRQSTTAGSYVQIAGYSARTGKAAFHEDRFSSSVGWQGVLWASPDGSALVISDPRGAKTRYGGRNNILGVLAGNKFTPIPHGADTGFFLAW
jgi:anti-sigma factor RsiW